MAVSGRELYDNKLKSRCELFLNGMPDFASDYYGYMSGKSENSKRQYLSNLKAFLEYISDGKDIKDITIKEVESVKVPTLRRFIYNYLPDVKKVGKSTCGIYYSSLKDFYDFLISDMECKIQNPVSKFSRPTDDKSHDPVSLTREQVQALLKCIDHEPYKHTNVDLYRLYRARDKAMIYLSLTTGMRIGTVYQLNVEDVNMESGEITVVTKGGKERPFGICSNEEEYLQEWLEARKQLARPEETALFVSRSGKRLEASGVTRILKKYTDQLGISISYHKLRSTCATILYEETGNIFKVANTLGHKNVTTTQRYINTKKKEILQSADELDNVFSY